MKVLHKFSTLTRIGRELKNFRQLRGGIQSSRILAPVDIDLPILWISQIQRSGGTLLSQLFDGHPQIYSHPYEMHWGRPNKWDWPFPPMPQETVVDIFRRLEQPWLIRCASNGRYTKNPGSAYPTYPFLFDVGVQEKLFVSMMEKMLPTDGRTMLNTYLTSFFNAWLDYQNLYGTKKKFTCGFTPRALMVEGNVERFMSDFPDGYIISSIRHPSGWYSSAKKHGFTEYGDLEDIIFDWIRSCEGIERVKDCWPDRIAVIRFEDLVREPDVVMRALCDFLSLQWTEILVTPTFNSIPIESNSHFNPVKFVDHSVADRYLDVLSFDERKRIESLTAEHYERVSSRIDISCQ